MNASDEVAALLLDKDNIESVISGALATLTGQALDDGRDFDLVERTLTRVVGVFISRALRGKETSDQLVADMAADERVNWEEEDDDEYDAYADTNSPDNDDA